MQCRPTRRIMVIQIYALVDKLMIRFSENYFLSTYKRVQQRYMTDCVKTYSRYAPIYHDGYVMSLSDQLFATPPFKQSYHHLVMILQ